MGLADRVARMTDRRSRLGFVARTLRGAPLADEARYLVWTQDLLDAGDLARCFPDLAAGDSPIRSRRTHGTTPFRGWARTRGGSGLSTVTTVRRACMTGRATAERGASSSGAT